MSIAFHLRGGTARPPWERKVEVDILGEKSYKIEINGDEMGIEQMVGTSPLEVKVKSPHLTERARMWYAACAVPTVAAFALIVALNTPTRARTTEVVPQPVPEPPSKPTVVLESEGEGGVGPSGEPLEGEGSTIGVGVLHPGTPSPEKITAQLQQEAAKIRARSSQVASDKAESISSVNTEEQPQVITARVFEGIKGLPDRIRQLFSKSAVSASSEELKTTVGDVVSNAPSESSTGRPAFLDSNHPPQSKLITEERIMGWAKTRDGRSVPFLEKDSKKGTARIIQDGEAQEVKLSELAEINKLRAGNLYDLVTNEGEVVRGKLLAIGPDGKAVVCWWDSEGKARVEKVFTANVRLSERSGLGIDYQIGSPVAPDEKVYLGEYLVSRESLPLFIGDSMKTEEGEFFEVTAVALEDGDLVSIKVGEDKFSVSKESLFRRIPLWKIGAVDSSKVEELKREFNLEFKPKVEPDEMGRVWSAADREYIEKLVAKYIPLFEKVFGPPEEWGIVEIIPGDPTSDLGEGVWGRRGDLPPVIFVYQARPGDPLFESYVLHGIGHIWFGGNDILKPFDNHDIISLIKYEWHRGENALPQTTEQKIYDMDPIFFRRLKETTSRQLKSAAGQREGEIMEKIVRKESERILPGIGEWLEENLVRGEGN